MMFSVKKSDWVFFYYQKTELDRHKSIKKSTMMKVFTTTVDEEKSCLYCRIFMSFLNSLQIIKLKSKCRENFLERTLNTTIAYTIVSKLISRTVLEIWWLYVLEVKSIELNEFRIDFYQIFWIIFHLSNQSNHKFSNRTNFEPIHYLKNLTPPYSWSRIEQISNLFHQMFWIFFALLNQ